MDLSTHNRAYLDAWEKQINSEGERALILISLAENGQGASVKSLNGLSTDEIKNVLKAILEDFERPMIILPNGRR